MGSARERQELLQVERQAQLDDLLSRWHHWQTKSHDGRAFNSRALVCGEYRTSRQYDDTNGALDDDLEAHTMRQIDFEVRELGDPWRSAVYALARSLCVGAAVFHSPRIPPEQRAAITAEARERLTARLISAGVI
jgi:hypothetical protein